jgi:hypothetical protein
MLFDRDAVCHTCGEDVREVLRLGSKNERRRELTCGVAECAASIALQRE